MFILLPTQQYVNLITNNFFEPIQVNSFVNENVTSMLLQVLLSRVSFFGSKDVSSSNVLEKYRESAEAVMCGLLPRSPTATTSRTRGNLPSFSCFLFEYYIYNLALSKFA